MKIGIIGSGNIGGTVGRHFARAGHDVLFSSRHPEDLSDMAEEVGAQTGTPEEAARFGDVILLATPFGQNETVAQQIRPLEGKILIDATNPYPSRDGEVAQRIRDNDEQVASDYTVELFPETRVVKAFSSVYYESLQEQAFSEGDQRIAVQLAADDEEAKQTVAGLIEDIGFAPQDLGGLEAERYFEPEALLFAKNLPIREAEARYREHATSS